jgi:hypothetical protein
MGKALSALAITMFLYLTFSFVIGVIVGTHILSEGDSIPFKYFTKNWDRKNLVGKIQLSILFLLCIPFYLGIFAGLVIGYLLKIIIKLGTKK